MVVLKDSGGLNFLPNSGSRGGRCRSLTASKAQQPVEIPGDELHHVLRSSSAGPQNRDRAANLPPRPRFELSLEWLEWLE